MTKQELTKYIDELDGRRWKVNKPIRVKILVEEVEALILKIASGINIFTTFPQDSGSVLLIYITKENCSPNEALARGASQYEALCLEVSKFGFFRFFTYAIKENVQKVEPRVEYLVALKEKILKFLGERGYKYIEDSLLNGAYEGKNVQNRGKLYSELIFGYY